MAKTALKEYTTKEWTERENYYIEKLSQLTIPGNPTTKDILTLTSELDSVYTEASFDCANIKRKEALTSIDLKNFESTLFIDIKLDQLKAGNKVTETDVKGLVKKQMTDPTNILPGYTTDIYTIYKAILTRLEFIERVIKIISEKKAAIISATAMLKLEGAFSSAIDK